MSLFGKRGMTVDEAHVVVGGMKALAEAVAERLKEHDKQIEDLQAEIQRLKQEPRKTVAQRARERGQA